MLLCSGSNRRNSVKVVETLLKRILLLDWSRGTSITKRSDDIKTDLGGRRGVQGLVDLFLLPYLLTSLGEVDKKKLLQKKPLVNPHPLEEDLLVVVRLILLVAVIGALAFKREPGLGIGKRSWIRHWLGMALD